MKTIAIALLALMFTASAFAHPYLRVSAGTSDWDSPAAPVQGSVPSDLFDDSQSVAAIAIGAHVTDRFKVELEYTDFGSGSMAFNDSYQRCFGRRCRNFSDDHVTDWEAYGVTGWVVYDIYSHGFTDNLRLTLNARGGITRITMKGTVDDQSLKDDDSGVAYGLGADLDIGQHWQANLSWEQHSVQLGSTPNMAYEPEVAKLGVTYRF